MATNKKSRDALVATTIAIALILVVMLNLLADRFVVRGDLTSEKKYSLSQPFRNILGRLDDKTTITYYVTEQWPSEFENIRRDIVDKLKDIEQAGGGNIELKVVDPAKQKDKELADRLEKEGFKIQAPTQTQDQVSITLIFTGIEISYKEKPKASIPRVVSAEGLEYQVGNALVELTTVKKPIIALRTPPVPPQPPMGFGQRPQGSGFEWMQQLWGDGKKFEFKTVELSESSTIPEEAALAIVARPKALSERQKYEICRYLSGGGQVLLLTSPYTITSEFGWRVEKTPSGLEDYLKELGVSFGEDLVADHSDGRCGVLPMQSVQGFAMVRSPVFVRVLPQNIDQGWAVTRFMPNLMLPFPVEIKLDEAQVQKNKFELQVLARSSKQTWTIPYSETIDFAKTVDYDPAKQTYTGQRNLFVMLRGQFPFAYEGKPVPAWQKGPEPDKPDKDKKGDAGKDKAELAHADLKPGRLLICTAPDAWHQMYLSNQFLERQMESNVTLLVNLSETLSMGEDLTRLRNKQNETRSIVQLGGVDNDFKRAAIKGALILGPAVLVVLVAISRLLWRKWTQSSYERKFAQTIGPSSFNP